MKKTTKIEITAEAAEHNFNTMADELIRTASSERAVVFAENTIAAIRARGAQFMADNAVALQILSPSAERFMPVADNRAFYMSALQMTLLK